MATSGNDAINVQRGNVGGGAGDDTFIISPALVDANDEINITDGDGSNTVQLIGGLTITGSSVASNTLQLTLSNGAVITILDASDFTFVTGGDPLTGTAGETFTFDSFVTDALGYESVPGADDDSLSSTTELTVNSDGSVDGGSDDTTDGGDDTTDGGDDTTDGGDDTTDGGDDTTDGGDGVGDTFTLAADVTEATEGDTVTYTITNNAGAVTEDTAVAYTIGGVDAADISADELTGTATIAAGASSVTFTVTTVDDGLDEAAETMTVTLDDDTGASLDVTVSDPEDAVGDATFQLTTGIDSITATADNQSVFGIVDTNNAVSTLNAGDAISGGGFDNVDMTVVLSDTDYAGTASISGIDTIYVQSVGAQNFTMNNIAGLDAIFSDTSTGVLTLNNLGSTGIDVGLDSTDNGLTVNYQTSAVSGSDDTVTIVLNAANGGAAQDITLSNGIETYNINSTGEEANDIGEIIDGGDNDTDKLTVEGDQNLRLRDQLDTNIDEVDATGFTGNLRIDDVDAGNDMSITGGDGDDRIGFAAGAFDDDDTVNGGSGTDILEIALDASITDEVHTSSIETLYIVGDDDGTAENFSADFDNQSSIATVRVTSGDTNTAAQADTLTVRDVTTGATTVQFIGQGTGSASVDEVFDHLVMDYDTTSDVDTVTVEVNNGGTEMEDIDVGDLTVNNVDNVNIVVEDTSNDSGEGADLGTLTGDSLETVTVTSDSDITGMTIDNDGAATLDTVDASAVGDDLTLTVGNTTSAVTITGSENGDNDITVNGSGADTVILEDGENSDIVQFNFADDVTETIEGFDEGASGDILEISIADIEAMTITQSNAGTQAVTDLSGVDDDNTALAAGTMNAKTATGATTLDGAEDFLIITDNYNTEDALETGLETGGTNVLTTGTATNIAAGDGFLALYDDGSDTYLALVVTDADPGGASSYAADDLYVQNLVKFDGIDDATDFSATNFLLIA